MSWFARYDPAATPSAAALVPPKPAVMAPAAIPPAPAHRIWPRAMRLVRIIHDPVAARRDRLHQQGAEIDVRTVRGVADADKDRASIRRRGVEEDRLTELGLDVQVAVVDDRIGRLATAERQGRGENDRRVAWTGSADEEVPVTCGCRARALGQGAGTPCAPHPPAASLQQRQGAVQTRARESTRIISRYRRSSAASARPGPGCRDAWSARPSGTPARASRRGRHPAACR